MDRPDAAPRFCVTGTEAVLDALAERLAAAEGDDLHEARLDFLDDIDDGVFDLLRRHGPRLVATCRRAEEGGGFAGTEDERLAVLARASDAGVAFVDVEADVLDRAAGAGIPAGRTLASIHAADVAELGAKAEDLVGRTVARIKLAAPVRGAADLVALRRLRERLGDRPAVVVGMGDAGLWTRIRPRDVGSDWTFVAAGAGLATAPGQVTRARAVALRAGTSHLLRPLAVAGGPQVTRSLGTDVYNLLFASRGIDLQYVPLPAASWDEIEEAARVFGVAGLSVTMPFKRDACRAASSRDPAASRLGAANTLVREDGGWRAANTDAVAARWLLAGLGLRPGHGVRILGAGATAVTVAEAADGMGARVVLAARDPGRCRQDLEALPPELSARAAAWEVIPWERRARGAIDVLVNATPVGADGTGCPWDPADAMPPRVLDVVRPPEGVSPLVCRAAAEDRRVADGLAFWCRQGAAQVALLAGLQASPGDLRAAAGQARGTGAVGPDGPRPFPGGDVSHGPVRLQVPGSKSSTQRALVLAALADSPSRLDRASPCDDSRDLAGVLSACGVRIGGTADRRHVIPGPLLAPARPVPCGEGATTARFAACLALRMDGTLAMDLGLRLRERPLGPLASALGEAGVEVRFDAGTGRLEVRRVGPVPPVVDVDLSGSSQPATGLLLVAAGLPSGLALRPLGPIASRSYLDLTIAWMRRFAVPVAAAGDAFVVPPCTYAGVDVEIGADWSLAAFWLAAERLLDRGIDLPGLDPGDGQGDAVFPSLLAALDGPGDRFLDLGSTPDLLPPLAAAALFADGPVRIGGVAHARVKESDRPAVLARELRRLGARIDEMPDGLVIEPSPLHGPVLLDPAGDHRMAMTFGILSLVVPGIEVRDPGCVTKSYPSFWEDLEALRCVR